LFHGSPKAHCPKSIAVTILTSTAWRTLGLFGASPTLVTVVELRLPQVFFWILITVSLIFIFNLFFPFFRVAAATTRNFWSNFPDFCRVAAAASRSIFKVIFSSCGSCNPSKTRLATDVSCPDVVWMSCPDVGPDVSQVCVLRGLQLPQLGKKIPEFGRDHVTLGSTAEAKGLKPLRRSAPVGGHH